jgi:hypothetical protein
MSRLPGFLWTLKDFKNNNPFHSHATNLARVPRPEDGHVRPKHVEEYTQDKCKNKNVVFRTVIRLMYTRLMAMQQGAEIHYELQFLCDSLHEEAKQSNSQLTETRSHNIPCTHNKHGLFPNSSRIPLGSFSTN